MSILTPRSVSVWLASAAVATALVPASLAAPSPSRSSPSQAASTTTQPAVIARSRLATTRVWLTVRRTSRYDGVARVHMSVLRNGSWQSAGSLRVSGVFWFVATGPGSLCTWSVGESANSNQASPPVVTTRPVAVQLLLSPALGCGRSFHFHYHDGLLVRGR